jgi:hypothetical protein
VRWEHLLHGCRCFLLVPPLRACPSRTSADTIGQRRPHRTSAFICSAAMLSFDPSCYPFPGRLFAPLHKLAAAPPLCSADPTPSRYWIHRIPHRKDRRRVASLDPLELNWSLSSSHVGRPLPPRPLCRGWCQPWQIPSDMLPRACARDRQRHRCLGLELVVRRRSAGPPGGWGGQGCRAGAPIASAATTGLSSGSSSTPPHKPP